MTTEEVEVRRRAADYIAGRITIRDFELWLAPLAWSLDDPSSDAQLRELVAAIELKIAEYTGGAWRESELRDLIEAIAVPVSASLLWSFLQRPDEPVERSAEAHNERLAVSL